MKSNPAWPLLEQLPTGPIKDTLAEIQQDLDRIDQTRDVLSTLVKIERRVEDIETITIAIDTLSALSCDIEAGVNSVFSHLNEIFGEGWQSQAAPVKTQEAPDLPDFHTSQSKAEAINTLRKIRSLGEVLFESAGNKVDISGEAFTSIGLMVMELAEEALTELDRPAEMEAA